MATMRKHAGTGGHMVLVGERKVRVERVIQAPRDMVWKAYTEPGLVARWWGRGNPLDVERMELAPGGHWRFVEHSDGGTDGFEGRFREVRAPELLEQTFEWDGAPGHTAVTTSRFQDLGDDCTRITTDMLFLTGTDRDWMVGTGMEVGMAKSYAALEKVLAAA